MKLNIITLDNKNTKPEFPLDIILNPDNLPKQRVVSTDINGDLIDNETLNCYNRDFVECPMYEVSDWHNPAFVLGSFLLDIREIDGEIKEVVGVFSHDHKKFGVIGFYHERDKVQGVGS